MSAKEFYHKNAIPHIPRMPPEIWAAIIQRASYVPGGYDPDLMTLQLGVPATTIEKDRLQAWKVSLVTRRNLVRVNKAWYIFAIPFLYEYILLGRGRVLLPLVQGMERTGQAVKAGELSCSIGWWTRRLDVNMRDSPTKGTRAIMDTLAKILSHLPNLRILTFSITGHHYQATLPPNVLRSLACPDTLKFVHWYTHHLPSVITWSFFLQNYPNLKSVNVNEVLKLEIPNIHLDSLEQVHVQGSDANGDETGAYASHIWDLDLPAVRYATYQLDFSSNDEEQVENFFTAVGQKLSTIQLNQLYSTNDVELQFNLQITFEQILRHCPALEHICLLLQSWHMLSLYELIFPRNVKTLTLRVMKGQLSRSNTANLFLGVFKSLKYRNPSLRTIQLYSRSNIRCVQTHPRVLSMGLREMEEIGLVILDETGSILTT